jgi:hypothetical protein
MARELTIRNGRVVDYWVAAATPADDDSEEG